MPHRRDIRRLAMQVLYQIDLRSQTDIPAIRASLDDSRDKPEVCALAFELALAAWQTHEQADTLVGELAPAWPTHRQPPVDRAILRLAYYEMLSGYSPIKVAINEAIELAKDYCAANSPAFINGVLDKLAKQLTAKTAAAATGAEPEAATPPPPPTTTGDPWLDDAMKSG